ncbi:MAG: hypothetical protein J5I99_00065 [Verrucomicrobia bacterium]|nr:hypothetical protein [Verrucomicrobiota bacterium]
MTTLKYAVFIGVNLLLPWIASRYWIKKPISYWVTIPLYIFIINSLNILWAIEWGLSRKPGIAFFFYFVWALSAGYQSRRSSIKAIAVNAQDNEAEASILVERATKLLAKGQSEAALTEYGNVVKFYASTNAAKLATDYIDQIKQMEIPNKGLEGTGDPQTARQSPQP